VVVVDIVEDIVVVVEEVDIEVVVEVDEGIVVEEVVVVEEVDFIVIQVPYFKILCRRHNHHSNIIVRRVIDFVS
jgi:hypothetical protein